MKHRKIVTELVSFTLPLILSGLFQQLFSWVDAFIVGNVNGEAALAAIGATNSIYSLFVSLITGFTSGLSVLCAQMHGRGDKERIRETLSSNVFVLTLVFLFISIAGIVFTGSLLALMDTPENISSQAESYLSIMMAGIPFLVVYNVYSAVLRGEGNSRAPFTAVLVSSISNVVLDLLFVAGFGMSCAGAAAATVIAQAAMTVYLVIYIVVRYPHLRVRFFSRPADAHTLKKSAVFGFPPSVQSGITSAGNVVLQSFMNGFGEKTVAAITTAYRVDTVILLPIINLGSGISTLVAQREGSGDRESALKVLHAGLVLMVCVSAALTLLVFTCGSSLIAMFGLSGDTVLIGRSFFRGLSTFYVVFGLSMAVRGYLEGTGDMLFSALAGISFLVLRIVCSYALEDYFGNMVIAYAEAIAWVFLLIIVSLRYRMRRLNQKALWK